jgi:hypothetical protein
MPLLETPILECNSEPMIDYSRLRSITARRSRLLFTKMDLNCDGKKEATAITAIKTVVA